jgi:hypothetical protein
MTDDLLARLRDMCGRDGILKCRDIYDTDVVAAADRIEGLEYALRSIAEVPLGAEIPDRTTIWGLAKYMHETATDALKEGKDE